MARIGEKLTALRVSRIKDGEKLYDGHGLYLARKGNSRYWVARYGAQGKHELGLGPLHLVSLAEARERNRAVRLQMRNGVDPITAKREQVVATKVAAAKSLPFAECVSRYHAAHRDTWCAKHARDWLDLLTKYALPVLGELPASAIDTALIMNVLEPAWGRNRVTASRVRARLEAVLDWAKVQGFREGENPARWRGHLNKLLATVKRADVEHHAAMSIDAVPPFMAKLLTSDDPAARCLAFLTFTASRLTQARLAVWDEISDASAVWTLPAGRMKSRKMLRVPLAAPVVELLARIPRRSRYIFADTSGKPVPAGQLRKLLDENLTVHGFRSSFRDWAGERTNFPHDVCEAALAHRNGNATTEAYQRGDLLEKRRRLMAAWAQFCVSLPNPIVSNVATIGGRRAQA